MKKYTPLYRGDMRDTVLPNYAIFTERSYQNFSTQNARHSTVLLVGAEHEEHHEEHEEIFFKGSFFMHCKSRYSKHPDLIFIPGFIDTIGTDFLTITIAGKDFVLQDTRNQEKYPSITRSYVNQADIILGFDTTPFLHSWFKEIDEKTRSLWKTFALGYRNDIPITKTFPTLQIHDDENISLIEALFTTIANKNTKIAHTINHFKKIYHLNLHQANTLTSQSEGARRWLRRSEIFSEKPYADENNLPQLPVEITYLIASFVLNLPLSDVITIIKSIDRKLSPDQQPDDSVSQGRAIGSTPLPAVGP